MDGMSIEDMIFDIYLVMRFKGYNTIEVHTLESNDLKEVETKELPLPTRALHAFGRNKMNDLQTIIDFLDGRATQTKANGFGKTSNADTRLAILAWHIENNIRNGIKPLSGIMLTKTARSVK